MRDPRLRPYRGVAAVLVGTLVVQAASAAALFALKLGPGAERVREFYLGSEARFTAPRTVAGLLEVAIPHLLAIPLAVFTASHLVGFAAALRRRAFAVLAGLTFGSALAGVACGFGIRWLWPALAWAKLVAFCTFEATLLGWTALLAWIFFRPEVVTASDRAARAVGPAATATRAGGCPR